MIASNLNSVEEHETETSSRLKLKAAEAKHLSVSDVNSLTQEKQIKMHVKRRTRKKFQDEQRKKSDKTKTLE